jgi:hypothetical protein
VVENKWRAQRYGVHGTFVDISGNGAISVAEMLEQVLEDVRARRARARCLEGGAALPHHRRQRHVGRHAASRCSSRRQGPAARTATARWRAVTDWIAEGDAAITVRRSRLRAGRYFFGGSQFFWRRARSAASWPRDLPTRNGRPSAAMMPPARLGLLGELGEVLHARRALRVV